MCDSTLGRCVGGDGKSALKGEERREVDDAAAAAGRGRGFEGKHVCANVAAECKDGGEVYLDDLDPKISIALISNFTQKHSPHSNHYLETANSDAASEYPHSSLRYGSYAHPSR